MPVIITMTSEPITVAAGGIIYNYTENDRILKNISKNEYEVFYSGQNYGRLDDQLVTAVENQELFQVFYRGKKNTPYTYLGYTYNSNIIQYRTLPLNVHTNAEQRLQIHLIINDNDIENITVPIHTISGSGKYKKDILIHTGLRDANNNSIIEHNKNTSIGFYYYKTTKK
jgi:hypothetical protein